MTKDETILKIAQDNGIVSPNGLTTANTDREDFYEVAVWSVKKALEQAYEAGRQALAADLQRDLMNLPALELTKDV